MGLKACLGTGTATVTYDDLNLADCIFVWGANPASNHPRFVKLLLQARRRGVQIVVINPAKEAGMLRFASPATGAPCWQAARRFQACIFNRI